ncbi:hypothetical protein B296_00057414 [Ensete ventricosum]|uniref:Uncharacterized protein n=1 Tax=Ensete ventricosum TaxID=4639 RepID=A0A426WWQ4_ENSVE|nr:hypothetical protein B296_00057414 [Ensete ventricosum]
MRSWGKGADLSGEDDGALVEEEGEVVGEVEGPGEPSASRHHQHRAVVIRDLTEVGHGRRKGCRVRGHPVAHPTEVRQASHMGATPSYPHRRILEGF